MSADNVHARRGTQTPRKAYAHILPVIDRKIAKSPSILGYPHILLRDIVQSSRAAKVCPGLPQYDRTYLLEHSVTMESAFQSVIHSETT
jgi:hypothetical protein